MVVRFWFVSRKRVRVRSQLLKTEPWNSVSIRGFAWGQVLWGSFPRPPWWTFDLTLSPGRLGSIDSQIALLPSWSASAGSSVLFPDGRTKHPSRFALHMTLTASEKHSNI